MKKNRGKKVSRRGFLRTAIEAAVPSSILLCGFLAIVPASVFGKNSPASQINIGAIGTGRISRGHDIPGVWKYDNVRIMAVCDLDSKRAEDARRLVNDYYSKKTGKAYDGVAVYADYRELLKNGVLTTSTARTGPWERSTRGRLRCRAWRSSPQKACGTCTANSKPKRCTTMA